MRVIEERQMQLSEYNIASIKFNLKSRDEIPKVLRGLQFIYMNDLLRNEIFDLLEKNISPKANKNTGRPGMALWRILVMGVLRLDLNIDYDHLQELVNEHKTIRQMLGHSDIFDSTLYHIQTLKDNVQLLTPELLAEINQIIVKAGHLLFKKKENAALHGRCDSFVVETHVHYPTDINLLFDAMRKIIQLTYKLSRLHKINTWRQYGNNIQQLKNMLRTVQNKKRSPVKTDEQKLKRDEIIIDAHKDYMVLSKKYLDKSRQTLKDIKKELMQDIYENLLIQQIEGFMLHADRQLAQIERRVVQGEEIPHHEKVFSIFQPHTEWISKGKAGVPVELGLKVCIMEDHYQFILHHRVMEKQTDEQIAVSMVEQTQKQFTNFKGCSFDKGFHSKANQEILKGKLDLVVLPRKGKLSKESRAIEEDKLFRKARHQHSAVESAINALEVHGLDVCPDHGIDGFKRYIALAIVARNIHRIGAILYIREQKKEKRKTKKYFKRCMIEKIAA